MEEIKGIEKLKLESLGIQDKAKEIDIKDEISLETASKFLIFLKKGRKDVDKAFDPIIAKNHEAHKLAIATKKKYLDPWITAESIVKPQIAVYMAAIERARIKAERIIEKEKEEARLKEESQLAAAIDAEDSGNFEKRDEIMDNVIPEVAPAEYIPTPKLKGTSIRKIWKWEVLDIYKIPREYLQVDSSKITGVMRAHKGDINIPGIRIYSVDSVATRIK